MTFSEQVRIPELPSEQGLENALRQIHGDFYARFIERATNAWLIEKSSERKDNYEHVLFQADSLGAMLHHIPSHVRVTAEREYNVGFVSAREGVLAGLMAAEQWLGDGFNLRDSLQGLVDASVAIWERESLQPHISSALLERATEGLELLSPHQLQKVKVWEHDLSSNYAVDLTDMFSLGFGLALVESKSYFDQYRMGVLISAGYEDMKAAEPTIDQYDWDERFTQLNSAKDETNRD